MTSPTDAPLIHTSRGNLPMADLSHVTYWQDDQGRRVSWFGDIAADARVLWLIEEHWRDAELVKRAMHGIHIKNPQAAGGGEVGRMA